MSNRRFISCADTAKLVRVRLKECFPTVTFSVKSSTYSGGASITIRYTDGPTSKEVDNAVYEYSGARFDPMIDLKSYVNSELNGEAVHYGADYIFSTRSYSVAFLRQIGLEVCEKFGYTLPEIIEGGYEPYFKREDSPEFHAIHGGLYWSVADWIMKYVHQTTALPPQPYRIYFRNPDDVILSWVRFHRSADEAKESVWDILDREYAGRPHRVLDALLLTSADDPARIAPEVLASL